MHSIVKYLYLCRNFKTMEEISIDKTKAQMRKGVLELCILSIISRKEAYASDILDEMKESDLLVVEGTLYPILTRLKNDGYLEYRWEESKSGPPRKYYTLTDKGNKSLTEMKTSWDEFKSTVEKIIHKII